MQSKLHQRKEISYCYTNDKNTCANMETLLRSNGAVLHVNADKDSHHPVYSPNMKDRYLKGKSARTATNTISNIPTAGVWWWNWTGAAVTFMCEKFAYMPTRIFSQMLGYRLTYCLSPRFN